MRSLIAVLSCIFLFACYNDNEEELYPSPDGGPSVASYSRDVKPIMDNYCTSCHSGPNAQRNVNLDGYDNTSFEALKPNSRLICTMLWECGQMPQGGSQLSKSTIDKIALWVEQGAENN